MKKTHLKSGFTLVELLVSISIFVIFLGVVATSYIGIVRSQRQANSIRKMYSEVRTMLEILAEDMRLGTIDYDCYEQNADISQCPAEIKGSLNGISPQGTTFLLVIANQDKQVKTAYWYDQAQQTLGMKKYVRSGNAWASSPEYNVPLGDSGNGFRPLLSQDLKVKSLAWALYPPVNPYSKENYSQNQYQFQPKVTAFLTVESSSSGLPPFHLDLQTSFSSRVYSRK